MGVDTKGVLVFKSKEDKDPFVLGGIIKDVLQKSPYCLQKSPGPNFPTSATVQAELRPHSQSISFGFMQEDGRSRALKVFFDVDYDHRDKGDHAVTLFLGHFGHSVEIMTEVVKALEAQVPHSKAFIQPDDSRDPYTPLVDYLKDLSGSAHAKAASKNLAM